MARRMPEGTDDDNLLSNRQSYYGRDTYPRRHSDRATGRFRLLAHSGHSRHRNILSVVGREPTLTNS
jgi:hypothetical protein